MSVGSGSTYVIDTSALLAYLGDEPGTNEVRELLELAEHKRCRILVPFIVVMETCYKIWRVAGEEEARQVYVDITQMPIERIDVDDRSLWIATEMKAVYRLSVADAWVLATAITQHAHLVHKDPDFDSACDLVSMFRLPYKTK